MCLTDFDFWQEKKRLSSSQIEPLGMASVLPNVQRIEKVEGIRKGFEMRELTKQHSRVAQLAADLSEGFEIQLAAIQLFVRVNCPLNLYMLALFLKSSSTPDGKNCCSAGWIVTAMVIHQIIRVLSICDIGQRVLRQVRKNSFHLVSLGMISLSSGILFDNRQPIILRLEDTTSLLRILWDIVESRSIPTVCDLH